MLANSLLNETEIFQSLSFEEQDIFLAKNHFKRALPALKALLEQQQTILEKLPETLAKTSLLNNLKVVKALLSS